MKKQRGIPEDLEFQIVQSLPVKSLARFNCVCKRWQSMILTHVNNNKEEELLLVVNLETRFIDFNAPNPKLTKLCCGFSVVGSVNGLLLCTGMEKKGLTVWNPWTQTEKHIPMERSTRLPTPVWLTTQLVYGLGYDKNMDDHIIVVVMKLRELSPQGSNLMVEVYLLKTQTRTLTHKNLFGNTKWNFNTDVAALFCNENLYWRVVKEKDNGVGYAQSILCFDLKEREFNEILPPYIVKGYFRIAVFGGRFCLVDWYDERKSYVHVWEWDCSWIHKVRIPCLSSIENVHRHVRPIILLKNGEFIVVFTCTQDLQDRDKGGTNVMFRYNPTTHVFTNLNVVDYCVYGIEITYKKSLLSYTD